MDTSIIKLLTEVDIGILGVSSIGDTIFSVRMDNYNPTNNRYFDFDMCVKVAYIKAINDPIKNYITAIFSSNAQYTDSDIAGFLLAVDSIVDCTKFMIDYDYTDVMSPYKTYFVICASGLTKPLLELVSMLPQKGNKVSYVKLSEQQNNALNKHRKEMQSLTPYADDVQKAKSSK